jgi:16S rRNA (guanine966-N2)-methyltransferase
VRIIAGIHRGRSLVPPRGDATRPITDRAKQSLFDVLSPHIDERCVVYDLFCGTGSMGLECLSRGAAKACFFDADRHALDGLGKNVDALRVRDRVQIFAGDLFKLAAAARDQANLLFLDPPYRYLVEKPQPLQRLSLELAARHAAPDAILIFRHDVKDQLTLPGWQAYDVRTYGSMMIQLASRADLPVASNNNVVPSPGTPGEG